MAVGVLLWAEALHRCPGLNQRAIDREMLAAQFLEGRLGCEYTGAVVRTSGFVEQIMAGGLQFVNTMFLQKSIGISLGRAGWTRRHDT
jgi:hypothetical protein